MRRTLFLMLSLGALLGGCAGGGGQSAAPASTARPAQIKQIACDDGGSGGVLIDGVCL